MDLVRAHPQLRLEMKDDARVERSAARSHHQAVECRESHGRVDALAAPHRAQARTIAQMRRDHPTAG